MQAVVDQVIVDTTAETTSTEEAQDETEVKDDIPVIRITVDGEDTSKDLTHNNKPTSFFPVAPAAETAPAHVRLRYIHALSTPPRWHLESELAYSWAGVGSLVSALEIFKRLRLWAEVALCLASNAAHGDEDEDGRGSGGEEKARAVLRWRLFRRTGSVAPSSSEQQAEAVEDDADEDVDISDLKDADWRGPERSPPPPNAPRLFCILGEIENDAGHYDRAWEISNHRFSRAQRSLAEHYLKQKELLKAKEAYLKAVAVNRLSSEMWGRLGDINLRLGEFSDAAEAYGRAIASANSADGGEDARTWSNLGSALYSLYVERVKELKKEKEARRELGEEEKKAEVAVAADDEEEVADEDALAAKVSPQRDPATLLSQSLAAYKRGASLTHDNWRIWDNVLTLASRLRPPAVTEMLFSLRKIITIRQNEDALDLDVLRLLLNECVLSQEKTAGRSTTGVYEPPRGSNERAVCEILETLVVPLITARSELWELIARERVWKRDYAGAVDAAEKAWRAAIGSASGGLLHSTSPSSLGVGSAGPNSEVKAQNWLEDKEAWQTVVERTDELVSILENYGEEIPEIGARWKGKARSAVRSVLGKAKESWEGSAEWEKLQELLAGLR
ncbi:hypothetical protein B0T17DRAFT_535645 [Bombardia bombarda]|uniref:TPR repeat-containing protein n=1 Tax=Bombardia bombarda TaxID=252184 RepID=A0AA40C2J5_9PEZI|nr:hypothetical protein B0T17DRAFT_535645 [Bombardia bombarda]